MLISKIRGNQELAPLPRVGKRVAVGRCRSSAEAGLWRRPDPRIANLPRRRSLVENQPGLLFSARRRAAGGRPRASTIPLRSPGVRKRGCLVRYRRSSRAALLAQTRASSRRREPLRLTRSSAGLPASKTPGDRTHGRQRSSCSCSGPAVTSQSVAEPAGCSRKAGVGWEL